TPGSGMVARARRPRRICRPGQRRGTAAPPGIILSVNAPASAPRELSVIGPERLPAPGAHPGRQPLVGLSTDDLRAWVGGLGEPPYRGTQIANWLYRRGARDFAEMTDLPLALRECLAGVAMTGRATTA